MNRFNIVSYVIDSMPETRLATDYAKKYTGRGWICRYHNGLKEITTNDGDRIVSADRTMVMDSVHSQFSKGINRLPKNAQSIDKGEYYGLLKNPTRAFDTDREQYVWLGDPDHYFHAENYCYLARQVRGDIRVVGLDPVRTPATAAAQSAIPQSNDEFAKHFPPGTPKEIIEQYRAAANRLNGGLLK